MSHISWWLKKRSLIRSKGIVKNYSLSQRMEHHSSTFKTTVMMLSSLNYFFSYKTSCKKYKNVTSILKYSRPSNLTLSALLMLSIKDNLQCLANISRRLGIKRRTVSKDSMKIRLSMKILRLRKISVKVNKKSNNKINLNQSLLSQKPTNLISQRNKLSKYTKDIVRIGMTSLRSLFAIGPSYLFMED